MRRVDLKAKITRRGMSELIVILLVIGITIPVAFILQSWLTQQAQKLPVIEGVMATYTVNSRESGTLVLLKVLNNIAGPITVEEIQIVFTNTSGTYVSYITPSIQSNNGFTLISGDFTTPINPKSSASYILHHNSMVRVESVIAIVKDDSGASHSVVASGA